MAASVARTDNEIADLENEAAAAADEGSKYPGMSYEEGITATLRWLQDGDADNPMSE